jgi:putative membrane protein
MRWWCSAVVEKWSWVPRPYLGVWILCGLLAWGYWRSVRRHEDLPDADRSPEEVARDRRRPWQFAGGLFFLWLASDWPVGTLGASYLACIHMMQYMLYSLAAAPLLMLGTPEWMGRRMLAATRLGGLYKVLSVPLVAAIVSNVVLIATHAPVSVDTLRSTQVGSFLLDMIWLLAGFILWTPIISPLPERRARTAPIKLVYLFAAAALMPMIPGGFLTFSSLPLYATYELAPRVGIEALNDQQMAGVLMKVGNLPVIWSVMGVIWFRWYKREAGDDRPTVVRDPVTGAPLRQPARRSTNRSGTSSDKRQAPTSMPSARRTSAGPGATVPPTTVPPTTVPPTT